MTSVVFVTHASVEVGGGHLSRCRALGMALARAGWRCRFAVPEAMSAEDLPFDRIAVPGGPLPRPARLAALLRRADLVVFDRYDTTAEHEAAIDARVLTIADGPARTFEADIVLDATPGRADKDYDGHARADAKLLLGPAYAPLHRAFGKARAMALARRAGGGPVRRVAVGLGAGAPRATDAAASVLRETCPEVETVVLGGMSACDVADALTHADLGVGAAGVSALERCALGLPSLAFALAGNQDDQLEGLARAGAVRPLGAWDKGAPERLASALPALLADAAARRAMSEAGTALVDAGGARRVVAAL